MDNNNKLISSEIKELIEIIKETGNNNKLFDKARTILNRNRNLLSRLYSVQLDDIVVNSLKTIINNYMKTKELKITPPEGYEIDKENSTFDCIKFKPIVKRFRDGYKEVHGYKLDNSCSGITSIDDVVTANDHVVFYNYKQAKSAKAMAIISQIMANDERFGGVVTDEEWENVTIYKFVINRTKNTIHRDILFSSYDFLAFHTSEQRDLFLKENEDLVKDYLMID